LLAPWVVFSVPTKIGLGQPLIITLVIVAVGIAGMFTRTKRLVLAASLSILLIIVGGRVVGDLYGFQPSDTSLLLSQFVATIFLMEATFPVLAYENDALALEGRDDALSKRALTNVHRWLVSQLTSDAKLGLSTFVMSLGLLVIGGIASIQVSHLALLAVFVLAAVVSLLFLLTYEREPEATRQRR